jgi:hypothetical protein
MSGFDPSESADHDVPPHPRHGSWRSLEPLTPAGQSLVDLRRDLEDALQELERLHERRADELCDRLAEVDALIRRQWALDEAEVAGDMADIFR